MDPIKEPDSIYDKFIYIFRKIFKKPKHEDYFVSSFSQEFSEKLNSDGQKVCEAIKKFGISCDQASTALRQFSLVKEEYDNGRRNNGWSNR